MVRQSAQTLQSEWAAPRRRAEGLLHFGQGDGGAFLGISDDTAYTIIKRDGIETFEVDYWKRIRKDVFEKWYKGQTKYRTVEDRERDKELEETGYTIPEIARMLLISRNEVYN